MNKETLKYLCSSMKAYTIFLTNFYKDTLEKYDYILDHDYNLGASFMFACVILLSIKEDLINGKTNNYEVITLNDFLSSLDYIATKSNNGYIIDGTYFANGLDVIGLIRNKIAHGNYIVNSDGTFTIFNDNKEIRINISNFIKFVVNAMKTFYKGIKEDIYTKRIVIGEVKNLNTKGEILNYLRKAKVYNFKLKRLNGNVESFMVDRLNMVIEDFIQDGDLNKLRIFQDSIKEDYEFSYEVLKKNDKDLEEIALAKFDKDMDNDTKAKFISEKLLDTYYKETKINIVRSLFKNMILLDSLSKVNSINKDKVKLAINRYYGDIMLDIKEIASASVCLFTSIFSYAIDYMKLPYQLLDLSNIDIDFYLHVDANKNSLYEALKSKLRELERTSNMILKDEENLENVKNSNREDAIRVIEEMIKAKNSKKSTLEQDIRNICFEIGKMVVYQNNNKDYIKNKDIINGIRNSISHGYVYIYKDRICFKDIFKENITFEGSINIIDFINMLYDNNMVIYNYLEDNKELKLIREF